MLLGYIMPGGSSESVIHGLLERLPDRDPLLDQDEAEIDARRRRDAARSTTGTLAPDGRPPAPSDPYSSRR